MQEMTHEVCGDAEYGESGQLTDSRDGKSYWITKLPDGNCWMTQNLALNLNGRTLTPSDSDVNGNWDGASSVTSALWNDTNATIIKWYASSTGSGHTSYGNYYSWQAATAGTGSSVAASGAIAGSSICPKGWRLPTQKQYATLVGGVNNSTLNGNPYYFQYGGLVNGGSLRVAGSQGYYWSSTASSGTSAYNLYFNATGVNPSDNNNRYLGLSVRCLVQGS